MDQFLDILSVISSFGTNIVAAYRFEFETSSIEWAGRILIICLGVFIILAVLRKAEDFIDALVGLVGVPLIVIIALYYAFTTTTAPLTGMFLGLGLWAYAFANISTALYFLYNNKWYFSLALGILLPILGFLVLEIEFRLWFTMILVALDTVIVSHALIRLSGGLDDEAPTDRLFLVFFFAMFGLMISIAAHSNLMNLVIINIDNDPYKIYTFEWAKWILVSGDMATQYSRWAFTLVSGVPLLLLYRRLVQ